MAQSGHTPQEAEEQSRQGAVTRYLTACREWTRGPMDRETVRRLATLERKARAAVGYAIKRT